MCAAVRYDDSVLAVKRKASDSSYSSSDTEREEATVPLDQTLARKRKHFSRQELAESVLASDTANVKAFLGAIENASGFSANEMTSLWIQTKQRQQHEKQNEKEAKEKQEAEEKKEEEKTVLSLLSLLSAKRVEAQRLNLDTFTARGSSGCSGSRFPLKSISVNQEQRHIHSGSIMTTVVKKSSRGGLDALRAALTAAAASGGPNSVSNSVFV